MPLTQRYCRNFICDIFLTPAEEWWFFLFTNVKSFHIGYIIDRQPIDDALKKGPNMQTKGTKTETPTTKTEAATKDTGRVRLGAGAIDFSDARDSTKDAGRVRLGAGAIKF